MATAPENTKPWTHFSMVTQTNVFWKKEHLVPVAEPWEEKRDQELFDLKKEIETSFASSYNWDAWKKICNPYEYIYTPAKDSNPLPSISLLNPLSRSYFKMWEMLELTGIAKKLPQRTRTAHVCEGPGGFIQAIYDSVERERKQVGSTLAMTLRPDHPSVPGWKRAANFLRRHKTIQIEYGPKKNGDILDPENQTAYLANAPQGVHIFTADGGFDFSDEYDKQELNIYSLLVNSILLATQSLVPEGSFVLKIFDIQSRATEDLLAICASQFKRWTLYKPATSRPCNSEKYFIGTGFRGRNPLLVSYLKHLAAGVSAGETFVKLLADDFEYGQRLRETIQRIQTPILEKQKLSIQNVLKISKEKSFEEQREESFKLGTENALDWCRVFRVPTRNL
jgi:23S rRNA U2552 (ribose-2'-O)-methylase RlmE/FtsJ